MSHFSTLQYSQCLCLYTEQVREGFRFEQWLHLNSQRCSKNYCSMVFFLTWLQSLHFCSSFFSEQLPLQNGVRDERVRKRTRTRTRAGGRKIEWNNIIKVLRQIDKTETRFYMYVLGRVRKSCGACCLLAVYSVCVLFYLLFVYLFVGRVAIASAFANITQIYQHSANNKLKVISKFLKLCCAF